MSEQAHPLPSFEAPPVIEVILGVQFDALKKLQIPQLGALWLEFRDRLPTTEIQGPLEPVFERFGASRSVATGVSFQVLDAPPIPRCWFGSENGNELLQVQQDRFIKNWRKRSDDDAYPRYERLRNSFEADYRQFFDFVHREKLGDVIPNQCEVTYVNHVLPDENWEDHNQLDRVLSVLSWHYSDTFLASPEEARATFTYIIRNTGQEPIGRLHIAAEPVIRAKDNSPMFRISLTARGKPQREGLEGIMEFFDLGREWVVRGFTSVTTKAMHQTWRRTQ